MNNKWAVLIGIDRYHESLGSLKCAGADCRALREALVAGPLAFPEDQVLLLDDTQDADRRPTFANIHSYLGSWLAAPKEDDLVFVYFAGHGRLADANTSLVPGDATLASLHTLGIPLRHVQDVLERCKAARKLLVLDACHSGAGRDVAVMTPGMQEALAQGSGFYTIASCGPDELSHEWEEKKLGVFSHFLTEALKGGCAPAADGRLTADSLYEWVHGNVVKWAAQHRCSQNPQRFAKGAGPLVLSQSAPDHAALAEQYRRELEETKARLAELELREAQGRLAKQKDVVGDDDRPVCVRAYVRTRKVGLLSQRHDLCGVTKEGREVMALCLEDAGMSNADKVELSPDGRRILFLISRYSERGQQLYVVSTDGAHLVCFADMEYKQHTVRWFNSAYWASHNRISAEAHFHDHNSVASVSRVNFSLNSQNRPE